MVARGFLEAIHTGDLASLQRLHTQDALVVVGDTGGLLTGAEAAVARPELRRCSTKTLVQKSVNVAADAFGDMTPASLRNGNAKTVNGTLSCPKIGGGIHETPIAFIVADDRVAVFAVGHSL